MTANYVAALVTDATRHVTAALGAYGRSVRGHSATRSSSCCRRRRDALVNRKASSLLAATQ